MCEIVANIFKFVKSNSLRVLTSLLGLPFNGMFQIVGQLEFPNFI